jgi:hypothetical protein
MIQSGPPSAAAEVLIDADADAIYAMVTDLATMAEIAEETEAMEWRKGDSARPGAVFKGSNRNGWHRWSTTCTVTHADPGRAFAFDVRSMGIPVAHWRYTIVAVDGGCRITEGTWDRRPGWFRTVGGFATGVHDRTAVNTAHIQLTLQRLKERAEDVQPPGTRVM